jgi:hypothetical protein
MMMISHIACTPYFLYTCRKKIQSVMFGCPPAIQSHFSPSPTPQGRMPRLL